MIHILGVNHCVGSNIHSTNTWEMHGPRMSRRWHVLTTKTSTLAVSCIHTANWPTLSWGECLISRLATCVDIEAHITIITNTKICHNCTPNLGNCETTLLKIDGQQAKAPQSQKPPFHTIHAACDLVYTTHHSGRRVCSASTSAKARNSSKARQVSSTQTAKKNAT